MLHLIVFLTVFIFAIKHFIVAKSETLLYSRYSHVFNLIIFYFLFILKHIFSKLVSYFAPTFDESEELFVLGNFTSAKIFCCLEFKFKKIFYL